MALGEIRCEEISNFRSCIYLGSFGASRKREAGTKSGCYTESILYLMSAGKRTFGRGYAFMHVREMSKRAKSKLLPQVRIFIKRISISWRSDLNTLTLNHIMWRISMGEIFSHPSEHFLFPKELHINFPCIVAAHHDSPYSLIYTAFEI